MKNIGWVVILIMLVGCGGGSGGSSATPKGDAYGSLTWAPDVVGADFSQVGVPPPIVRNQLYKLIIGPHRVFWQTDYLGCCLTFFSDVIIEGGTPGKDRIYNAAIGQNLIIWNESLVAFDVEIIQPLDNSPPLELPYFDGDIYEEGILRK